MKIATQQKTGRFLNEEDIKYAINLIKRCKKRKSGYRERDYEAFDIAIKALKSQVPKRVKYDNIPVTVCTEYAFCPGCTVMFSRGQWEWGYEFCRRCGQRLDWSEGK